MEATQVLEIDCFKIFASLLVRTFTLVLFLGILVEKPRYHVG